MNFFLNHAIISLNTAPKPQNIFLMIIEKHILIIENVLYKSSSNTCFVQVLHLKIRGVGVKTCSDLADTGGVQNLGKAADVILERPLTHNLTQEK